MSKRLDLLNDIDALLGEVDADLLASSNLRNSLAVERLLESAAPSLGDPHALMLEQCGFIHQNCKVAHPDKDCPPLSVPWSKVWIGDPADTDEPEAWDLIVAEPISPYGGRDLDDELVIAPKSCLPGEGCRTDFDPWDFYYDPEEDCDCIREKSFLPMHSFSGMIGYQAWNNLQVMFETDYKWPPAITDDMREVYEALYYEQKRWLCFFSTCCSLVGHYTPPL